MDPTTLAKYRQTGQENARTSDLIRLLPRGRHSVLDIGARDGFFSKLLAEYFDRVTAVDLVRPRFKHPRVATVQGDITRLAFADESFDCVFCTEVLEHVPLLERACQEISRVARHEIIIGVPFRQDLRCGRTTCRTCGKFNPPWAHLNSFTEKRLLRLFPNCRVLSRSFVGATTDRTNSMSALLFNLAGNPWGSYSQEEPCVHCAAALTAPPNRRSLPSRCCSAVAALLNGAQQRFLRPRPIWMHVLFAKERR